MMVLMQRLLLGFMTLLMLTPVLTCAMPFCPIKAAQAAAVSKSIDESNLPPCHRLALKQKAEGESKKSGPMFVLDCMGIDLSNSGVQADMPHPDIALDMIHHIWADSSSDYSFLPHDIYTIRGPPIETARVKHETPLILSTQRFRI
jgi:hypothetical protein